MSCGWKSSTPAFSHALANPFLMFAIRAPLRLQGGVFFLPDQMLMLSMTSTMRSVIVSMVCMVIS
jgi:hypothetical protein